MASVENLDAASVRQPDITTIGKNTQSECSLTKIAATIPTAEPNTFT
jgi:hypothetical protein